MNSNKKEKLHTGNYILILIERLNDKFVALKCQILLQFAINVG